MNDIRIPLRPSRYNERGHWEGDQIEVLVGSTRYGVGYVDASGLARRVYGGAKEPGPYAYVYGLATVIALHPIPNRDTQILLALGDVITLNGERFEVTRNGTRDIKLIHQP